MWIHSTPLWNFPSVSDLMWFVGVGRCDIPASLMPKVPPKNPPFSMRSVSLRKRASPIKIDQVAKKQSFEGHQFGMRYSIFLTLLAGCLGDSGPFFSEISIIELSFDVANIGQKDQCFCRITASHKP